MSTIEIHPEIFDQIFVNTIMSMVSKSVILTLLNCTFLHKTDTSDNWKN